MHIKQSLKQKLISPKCSVGSWITIAHQTVAEIMAYAGFEWLVVDLEHSSISISEAEGLIRTIDLCAVSPLVRLTSNDPNQIKRVMDAGAHGIIVPMVTTRIAAERAVDAVRYPTAGSRGVGLARAQRWGNGFESYLDWVENESVVIVQIEHIDAVNNLEDILSVDGVDGFMIGPYDLSGSLGSPGDFASSSYLDALQTVAEVGLASNAARGIHVVEPCRRELETRITEGYDFIAYSLDTRMIDVSCRSGLRKNDE